MVQLALTGPNNAYADLKAFIGKTVPVVEQHLGMAKMDPNMKM